MTQSLTVERPSLETTEPLPAGPGWQGFRQRIAQLDAERQRDLDDARAEAERRLAATKPVAEMPEYMRKQNTIYVEQAAEANRKEEERLARAKVAADERAAVMLRTRARLEPIIAERAKIADEITVGEYTTRNGVCTRCRVVSRCIEVYDWEDRRGITTRVIFCFDCIQGFSLAVSAVPGARAIPTDYFDALERLGREEREILDGYAREIEHLIR